MICWPNKRNSCDEHSKVLEPAAGESL